MIYKLFAEKGGKMVPFVECQEEIRKLGCSFAGRSIAQFIEIYGKMPNVDKLVTKNEDPEGFIDLCKDFIFLIASTIKQGQKIPLCANESKRNIVCYIERYLIIKLYTWYEIRVMSSLFPPRQSEEDIKLNKEIEKLQTLSYKSFEVKDTYYNEHLCKLAIKGTTYFYYRTKES